MNHHCPGPSMDHGLGVWGVRTPSLPLLQRVHALYHVMCDMNHTVNVDTQTRLVVSGTVQHSPFPLAEMRYVPRVYICCLHAGHACPAPWASSPVSTLLYSVLVRLLTNLSVSFRA
jgi:hypothetical protein